MATQVLSASRAGLGSVVVADTGSTPQTQIISNLGAHTSVVSVVPGAGAAAMNGVASMAAASPPYTGAAEMDGLGSMVAASTQGRVGTAVMGGAASMAAVSSGGAGNAAQMDGVASMIAKSIFTGVIQEDIDFFHVLDVPTAAYHLNLSSRVSIRPAPVPAWYAVLALVQNLTMHPVTSQMFIWGRILLQTFTVHATASVKGTYKNILAQLLKLSDVDGFSHTIPLALSQNIGVHSLPATGFSLKLLQNFLVGMSSSPAFRYHLTLASQVIVGWIINYFRNAILAQLFTVHPAQNRQYIASNSLAQLLTVHPAFNNTLILEIAEVGNIQLSPSQLVHMIYKGDPLLDGVVITALYISPSGTTTTWVVNTRTNAVTEYVNYDFRSFARMNNRYIAAGAAGLYELDGDTDDGVSIISEMMSGYLQLNEKKLFGIKGAYVAIRGGGRFYLKLIAGDGREYVYELKAQPNLMTTKVKVGKGIRTTYMAFDLVTEGQDFDLDSLEFIPMTSGRRV